MTMEISIILACEARGLFVKVRNIIGTFRITCAQSGFLAKIFQPDKFKKEEAEKLKESYDAGVKETIDSFVKASNLKWKSTPTAESNCKKAMKVIYNSINWMGTMTTSRECCDSWTQIFASKMNVETNVVDSMKAVIADMCLSDHYVSLMGSNGAAHTLTYWDGTHVNGLGEQTNKKGKSL